MMGESKPYTPEEIAKVQKSRTISDAELLHGGAEYEVSDDGGALLYATEQQKKDIYEGLKKDLLRLKDPKRFSDTYAEFIQAPKNGYLGHTISKGGFIDKNGQVIVSQKSIELARNEMQIALDLRERQSIWDQMTEEQRETELANTEKLFRPQHIVTQEIWEEMYTMGAKVSKGRGIPIVWDYIGGVESFVKKIKALPDGGNILASPDMQLAAVRLLPMTEGLQKMNTDEFVALAGRVKSLFSLSEEMFQESLIQSVTMMLCDGSYKKAQKIQSHYFSTDMLRSVELHKTVLKIMEAGEWWHMGGIALLKDWRRIYSISDEEFIMVLSKRWEAASLDTGRKDEAQALKEVLDSQIIQE